MNSFDILHAHAPQHCGYASFQILEKLEISDFMVVFLSFLSRFKIVLVFLQEIKLEGGFVAECFKAS